MEKEERGKENWWATADLWAGCFVVRQSQPHCGGCSLLTRGLPKPATSQFPQRRRTLRDPWCLQPKSLAAPSASIYEMACRNFLLPSRIWAVSFEAIWILIFG